VTVPEGVVSIGQEAFSQCVRMTRINLPNSVQTIAKNAFDECQYLSIAAPTGSYALSYARENRISYIVIDIGSTNTKSKPTD
jgi:hypothetical protein